MLSTRLIESSINPRQNKPSQPTTFHKSRRSQRPVHTPCANHLPHLHLLMTLPSINPEMRKVDIKRVSKNGSGYSPSWRVDFNNKDEINDEDQYESEWKESIHIPGS